MQDSHLAAALLAVAGAAVFAGGAVVEHLSARQVAAEPLSAGLLLRLVRRPAVALGLVFETGGFALQLAAISRGTLPEVQPLLVLDLPIAVAAIAAIDHRRPTRAELAAGAAALVGLALFQLGSSPDDGGTTLDPLGAAVAAAVVGTACAVLLTVAKGSGGRRRTIPLAITTALLYGSCGPLVKVVTSQPSWTAVFTSWQVYVMAVVGGTALALNQAVFQTARFGAALAVLTVSEPLVSSTFGATLLGEGLSARAGDLALWITGAVIAAAGLLRLATLPVADTAAVEQPATLTAPLPA